MIGLIGRLGEDSGELTSIDRLKVDPIIVRASDVKTAGRLFNGYPSSTIEL